MSDEQVLLEEVRRPRRRFARSINLERDQGRSDPIAAYLPVGRALDVVSRLAGSLLDSSAETAIAITGPYGSGKSSLGLLLDALSSAGGDPLLRSSAEVLAAASPETWQRWQSARSARGAEATGFLRCLATAEQESVSITVLRALARGLELFEGGDERVRDEATSEVRHCLEQAISGRPPSVRRIRQLLTSMTELAPVLLLIDEFGKNLEAVARTDSEADLFLLQELAEWSRGDENPQLALVTLQHLTYGEYAADVSAAKRREWIKVQGRFEEISFTDSPEQTLRLVAVAYEPVQDDALQRSISAWAAEEAAQAGALGFKEVADSGLIAASWPLHPAALAVLPELVQRYGQNERTLFSYVAGRETGAVGQWLRNRLWNPNAHLPRVGLDHVYDYFVTAAVGMVGLSDSASRWLEVNTRIRDARGLTEAQVRILKVTGLLNLVSAGGTVRASREVLVWCCVDGDEGTRTADEVLTRLRELEQRGLLQWRDFSDEYRVWSGTDFNLREAIERFRARLRHSSTADLLSQAAPLPPIIAARHSHERATLRTFARQWVAAGERTHSQDAAAAFGQSDGLILYCLGAADLAQLAEQYGAARRPVVAVEVTDASQLAYQVLEVAALAGLQPELPEDDWVVRREVAERLAAARTALDVAVSSHFGAAPQKGTSATWSLVTKRGRRQLSVGAGVSRLLSDLLDESYSATAPFRNDLLNRHELSSQGAKARRQLLEAMLVASDSERCGIEGFGPERSMYEAVLKAPGIHKEAKEGWSFGAPLARSPFRAVWNAVSEAIEEASTQRLRVSELFVRLADPPFGVRAGLAPVLLAAVLLQDRQAAGLYEHGTLRPVLTADLFERLVRNPENFQVKSFSSHSSVRQDRISEYVDALTPRFTRRVPQLNVMSVTGALVQITNALPEFTKRTRRLSASCQSLRDALLAAREPDDLLFEALPKALKAGEVDASRSGIGVGPAAFGDRLVAALEELTTTYPNMVAERVARLGTSLAAPADRVLSNLRERALLLPGVLDPRLKGLVNALQADLDDVQAAEYILMSVVGTPPTAWTDREVERFDASVEELGGQFRRVEALNHESLARSGGEGFEAVRVTVTRSDGRETSRLLWVDGPRREAAERAAREALGSVIDLTGNRDLARELLLAVLAAPTRENVGPTGYGASDQLIVERS